MKKNKAALLSLSVLIFMSCQRSLVPHDKREINPVFNNPDMIYSKLSKKGSRFLKVWEFNSIGAPAEQFLTYNGYIIIPTQAGRLFFIDPETGKRKNKKVAKGVEITASVSDKVVVVGLKKGKNTLLSYDAKSGTMLWKKAIGPLSTDILALSRWVVAGNESGWLFLVDIRDGSIIWKRDLKVRIKGITVKSMLKIYAATNDGAVHCLSIGKGFLLWTRQLSGNVFSAPAVVGQRIFIGTNSGFVYCISAISGSVLWMKHVPGAIFEGTSCDGSNVYVATTRSKMYSFNIEDGKKRWETDLPGIPGNTPTIVHGIIFSGTLNCKVVSIEARSGKILAQTSVQGKVISNLSVVGDMVIAGTDKGKVYGFRIK